MKRQQKKTKKKKRERRDVETSLPGKRRFRAFFRWRALFLFSGPASLRPHCSEGEKMAKLLVQKMSQNADFVCYCPFFLSSFLIWNETAELMNSEFWDHSEACHVSTWHRQGLSSPSASSRPQPSLGVKEDAFLFSVFASPTSLESRISFTMLRKDLETSTWSWYRYDKCVLAPVNWYNLERRAQQIVLGEVHDLAISSYTSFWFPNISCLHRGSWCLSRVWHQIREVRGVLCRANSAGQSIELRVGSRSKSFHVCQAAAGSQDVSDVQRFKLILAMSTWDSCFQSPVILVQVGPSPQVRWLPVIAMKCSVKFVLCLYQDTNGIPNFTFALWTSDEWIEWDVIDGKNFGNQTEIPKAGKAQLRFQPEFASLDSVSLSSHGSDAWECPRHAFSKSKRLSEVKFNFDFKQK